MLIRFSVENFLSFKGEIEFSMIPGKSREHPDHIITNGKRGNIKTLKAAVIYGANASGKSNLVKAMGFAHYLITKGTSPRENIPVSPFRFDADTVHQPSKFEFEFKHNAKSFIYGFRLDSKTIHEEWLYQITATTEKMIFERKTNAKKQAEVEFGNIKYESAEDRNVLKYIARTTRPNQLFLTETIQRSMKYFEDAFNWFDKILLILAPDSVPMYLEAMLKVDSDFKQSFQNYLRLFDVGISDIELKEVNVEEEIALPKELRDKILEKLEENKGIGFHTESGRYVVERDERDEIKAYKLMTIHNIKGGASHILLEASDESDGTQRLFDLIPALIELLEQDRVFVIDELDRSLHPHLSSKIVELFLNNKPGQSSQLIATTHESSLLDLDLLRRDEIWFVEKDADGVSTTYSLEEFAPRNDKDIKKGYLLGRFGAIPMVKNVHNLDWIK